MSPISQRFAIPTNDDVFEEMCLQLLRRHWSRKGLELFGKRGDRQFGIDILDIGGETPVFAAQCKLKEEHKNLPPADIEAEVNEAKKFSTPLGKYAILTTAKISTQAHTKIREINQLHRATGHFEVELLTWEHICSLLQIYDDVREQFYEDFSISRAKRIEANTIAIKETTLAMKEGMQSLTSHIAGDHIDDEINEARDCIVRREFQTATFLLNRIQRTHDGKLSSRQKFRILSNHGSALLGVGKQDAAAKFLLDALQWQPDDQQARTNEVLAYFLAGDFAQSHAKAEVLRAEYPASSLVAALWLDSAPQDISFRSLESEINTVLRNDPDVCVALARRALRKSDFDSASAYASKASINAPKWSQPQLLLAQVSMGRALHAQLSVQVKSISQESALLKAEQASSKAIDFAHEEKDYQTEKIALIHRVDIRLLLKKTAEATSDAERAEKINPDDPTPVLATAQILHATGRTDEAIASFKRAYGQSQRPDIAFVYATALQNRGKASDIDEAISILTGISLPELHPDIRPTTAMHVVQCFSKKSDWLGAEAYLTKVSDSLDTPILSIMRGYLSHYQSNAQDAERYAMEARSIIPPVKNPSTAESLARLLMLIGKPADALPLWQELFDMEVPGFDPKNLVACAAKLHRDDIVLQTCERLRGRGISDWSLIEFEIQFLEKYKIEDAIKLLKEFLIANPDSKLAKLRLSLIGLRLNRQELVHGKVEDLPEVNDLPLIYAVPAAQVLKFGGNPESSVDYAYRFLRLHFGEIEAHHALILSMMPGTYAPNIPARLEVIAAENAVCYQELPVGIPTWVVLERTDRPCAEFEEIPLNSPLATELLGKRVGDTVVLFKSRIQDRVAKILEIVPKYVRRYQDCAGEMQIRFGAASSVESIRVEEVDSGSENKGLSAFLSSIEKRATAVADARSNYDKLPMPLHWYGALFGKDAYHAMMSLAAEPGQEVKCCLGQPEERAQALEALKTAKGLVVDISALATLRLLNLEKILSTKKFHLIISERTWLVFQFMLSEERLFSAPGGTLYYKDGRHVMYEESQEEREHRHRQDEEFVKLLENSTERRSGVGMAAMLPDKRELLEKFFGEYGVESMVLASDPSLVLWTDDLIQAQTSAQEFGTRRIWTQLLLGTFADAGLITYNEYSEASAILLGMEFVATLFDSLSMLAAFRLASWSVERPPAIHVIKIFSEANSDMQVLMKIFVEFLMRLFQEPVSPETRCLVTRAFLDAFSKRPEALALLSSLRKLSSRLFSANEPGRTQFDECFDRWAERKGGA